MPDTNTPSSTPSPEPTPTPVVRPQSGDVVIHTGSGKFYTVASNDGETVAYTRFTDDAGYNLTEQAFIHKFRKASENELTMLNLVAETMRSEGIVPDLRNVTLRYIAAQQANDSQGQPDSAQTMIERRGRREIPEVGVLVETTEADSFENLILNPETVEEIRSSVTFLQQRDELSRIFGLDRIQSQAGKSVINLHGKPGTGKTRAARVVARLLGKSMYQVDYSAMISKYVGDTAKHISAAFAKAKELGAVLFWDEADSLCSRRTSADDHVGVSINQNRNVLMQELDRFDGVVIMSTNFVKNFDPAIVRRIARNVEFKLPTKVELAALFRLHFPVMDRVRVTDGFQALAAHAEGFSGGDVLNVALNSIQRVTLSGDPSTWEITEEDILREVVGVHRTKLANGTTSEISDNDLRGRLRRAETALARYGGESTDIGDIDFSIN